ncbi:lamin tail domain-containing protein [Nocardioides sp.]|uniref:lamin tail domain-containing protein n=1 Tax=Nocardioides sp. TaxID=35761 RepID=UPI001A1D041A|nr:lamin tail domain-containing protein [Nocardioides sp.]MBJ7357405.1 lamin tail domain-containing protein [Nocardioides sp.]
MTLRRPALSVLTSLLLAGAVLVGLSGPARADDPLTSIRINEVESNGDVRDWVELTNVGATTTDVGGLVLMDNQARSLTIPTGTSIAPGGFLAVDVDDPAVTGSFGLGGADQARVFLADGTTLVDSYSWATHAAITYGRCPDGTGAFANRPTSTKGLANDCSVPGQNTVKVNEVESNGDVRDWIELTNTAGTSVDVGGWVLMDNQTRTLAIPAGTTIAPGGHLAVDVDDPAVTGSFGLGSADQARVFLPDGTTLVDSHTWTAHAAVTYGRCPNGLGAFGERPAATKAAANDCGPTGVGAITFNEVESNGDPVGDWAELTNTSGDPVDISGMKFKDGDDTHAFYVIPAGTVLAPGGFHVLNEAQFNFGLGGADTVRLYLADEATLVDSYGWATHAATTYGRCPDGTGAFTTTGSSTEGAANNCAPLLRINEVESDGGSPADWVELYNYGTEPADLGGLVLKDADDAHSYAIPAGTTLAAGGYHVVEQAALGFELDGDDSARLFASNGTTLYDSYAWTAHATTTYGRCPNGSGAFATTQLVTKGALNNCPGDLVTETWPGGATVSTADVTGALGGDVSGLTYDGSGSAAPGVLWAVNNGDGTLVRMLWNGSQWASDTANGWSSAGKPLKYADGNGTPDTEGVTVGGASSAAGIYTSTERNNTASGTSKPTILRYDVSGSAASLTATNEWNIGPDLPGGIAANAGPEAITWVPDTYLTAHGLKDEAAAGAPYDPASYPDHGTGLFFVALEANSRVYAYALNHADNTFTRIASFASGYTNGVMALDWEEEQDRLWVVCDDTCGGLHATFEIDTAAGATQGTFVAAHYYERPSGMPNLNNEGFTTTPRAECAGGVKPVFWTDDAATGGNAVRAGTLPCTPRDDQIVSFTTSAPASPVVGDSYTVAATGGASGNPVVLAVAAGSAGVCSLTGSTVQFDHAGTCVVEATQAGSDDYLAGSASQSITVAKVLTDVTVAVTSTTVTATVTPRSSGAGTPAGTVQFSVDGTVVGSAPLSGGTATLTHTVPTGGARTVEASYQGSLDHAVASGSKVRRDPALSATLLPVGPLSATGWYTDPVQVLFSCSASGSPLSTPCPEAVTLDTSGADQSVTRSVMSQDGGAASVATPAVDIDLEAPTVKVAGVRDGATYTSKPDPRCKAKDKVSGVARCTVKVTRTGTSSYKVVVKAVDVAGHRAKAVETYRLAP